MLRTDEILSTVQMLHAEHLDVRTVALALNVNDCAAAECGVDLVGGFSALVHKGISAGASPRPSSRWGTERPGRTPIGLHEFQPTADIP